MSIQYVEGDATQPRGEGSKIIVHVVNNLGVWGSGFVIGLSNRWPRTRGKYMDHAHRYGLTMGEVQFCVVESSPQGEGTMTVVASIVGQKGLISRKNPHPFCPTSFRAGLKEVARLASQQSASVHMPRIGTGRGGAKWEEVEPIIQEELVAKGVSVTVYDYLR